LINLDTNLENNEKNLKMLAVQVLNEYNIVPEEMSIIQSGGVKTVWKFKDKKGVFCLKRLKQTLDKALFSVNAQLYIKDSGGNVPGICLTVHGEPIVKLNDQLFVVYEWLNGRDLNFSNSNDLALALGGLAKFHITSKGYISKEGARVSSKLGKWLNQYESMKNKFVSWKEIARAKTSPAEQSYVKWVDGIKEIAEEAIKLLEKSSYNVLTSIDSNVPVLCHQDYGRGNAILTDKGIIVLDLDGVTFDLPARDLRKIIGKMAENNGKWDADQITKIINWYSCINPISEDEKKVLYIDLLFPHWFFGLVKNQFDNGKILKSSEIERISKLELSKLTIIKELLMR
jgi:spore coat protein I